MCPANYITAASRQAMLNDSPSPYSRQLHILVVDDIASMRRVMCSLLRDELRTVRITEAADGDSALKLLESAESDGTPVDFVVTDWNMPHMDGIELLKAIRELEPMRHLPVLMVTAQATKDMILTAAHAGADGYIVKPFNAATLKSKLEQIFARRTAVAH